MMSVWFELAAIAWVICGWLTTVWHGYLGWRQGEDITVNDAIALFLLGLLGPLYTVGVIRWCRSKT